MQKIKKKQQFIITYKLFLSFHNKDKPKKIMAFIYKNLYKLIDEIDYFPDPAEVDGQIFEHLFHGTYYNYYEEIIKNTEEIWLKTLFPIHLKDIKDFYLGLVGRLIFFSEKQNDIDYRFYWYGDQNDWSISYYLYIDSENNLIQDRCKFIFLKNYNEIKIFNAINDKIIDARSRVFVLYENNWMEKSKLLPEKLDACIELYKDIPEESSINYLSKINSIKKMIEQYKINVNLEQKTKIDTTLFLLWSKINLELRYLNMESQFETIAKQIDLILNEKEEALKELNERYKKKSFNFYKIDNITKLTGKIEKFKKNLKNDN